MRDWTLAAAGFAPFAPADAISPPPTTSHAGGQIALGHNDLATRTVATVAARFARQGQVGWRVQIVRPARFARHGQVGWQVQIVRPT